MSELKRANKVTVKTNENGRYVAEFYRTRKKITTVTDIETGWEAPVDSTKTGERESFRAYVIENANTFGVEWKPEDMRDLSNVRSPKYSDDATLMNEAMEMMDPDIRDLISKCKYEVKFESMDVDTISPKTKTGNGVMLSALGIKDGKYEKSGNWAWADIAVNITMKFKGDEIYYTMPVELVSGQLKKPKITVTSFNEYVRGEIMTAGLATEEELDPKKESAKPIEEVKEVVSENVNTEAEEKLVKELDKIPEEKALEVESKSGRKRSLARK